MNSSHIPLELDQSLFQENLEFWSNKNASLAVRVRKLLKVSSTIIHPSGDTDKLDILVEGKPFWRNDTVSETKEFLNERRHHHALTGFLSTEQLKNVGDSEKNPLGVKFRHHWRDFLEENTLSAEQIQFKNPEGLTVFVIGLGLGHVLQELVENFEYRNIFIAEEQIELFYQSFYVINYRELSEKLAEKGGDFFIEIADINNMLMVKAFDFIKHNFFSYIYSAKIILNDKFLDYSEVKEFLAKKANLLTATRGFIVDEFVMLRNQGENLFRQKIPLINLNEQAAIPNVPCFIVGNGPSLNSSAEVIRKYKDKAIVISCGTTLRSLLVRGIKPDIHVEIENVELTAQIHQEIAEEFDTSGIIFIGSSTVHPTAVKAYDNSIAFSRDGMRRFNHFNMENTYLRYAEPAVNNTALGLAIRYGFKEVYLFGIDLGTTENNKEKPLHASGNVYDASRKGKLVIPEDKGLLKTPFPANFGGAAYSTGIMMLFLTHMEIPVQLLKGIYDIDFYNCSDGIRLKGYIPKLPEQVNIQSDPNEKIKTIETITSSQICAEDIPKLKQHFCDLYDPKNMDMAIQEYDALLKEYVEWPDEDTVFPLFEFWKNLERYFEKHHPYADIDIRVSYINHIISGSVYQFSQFYYAADSHLSSDQRKDWAKSFLYFLREIVIEDVKEEYLKMCEEFRDIREGFLADIEATENCDK